MTESPPRGGLSHTRSGQGLVAGLVAGMAMVIFTVAVRLVWDALTMTELAAEWFTSVLPTAVFDLLLDRLSFSAKPLMFAGLLVAQVMVGGAIGAGYGRLVDGASSTATREWARALGLALALWMVSLMTLVPAFGGGFLALSARGGVLPFLVASLGAYAVYGLSLGYLLALFTHSTVDAVPQPARRRFLRQMLGWALFSVAAIYGVRFLLERAGARMSASGAFRTAGVLSTEVTPNDEFYVVSANIIDPIVNVENWTLEVAGLVEEPITLTYDGLRAMPAVEQYVTLECISNEVGGDLVSNALWKGVRLSDILEIAVVGPGAQDVSFEAWDGYDESVSLSKAMSGEVMVAYEMNGQPLPNNHGFPARLIIPGFFGLKSVKWLTRIAPVDHDFQGYWQRRGWTDVPIVKTMSRFDTPASGTLHPLSPISLGGVAFASDRGISKVEISTDDGEIWTEVETTSKPLSRFTWVIWESTVIPAAYGRISLLVRATDGEGIVQTAERVNTLPDGATGQHQLRLTLSSEVG